MRWGGGRKLKGDAQPKWKRIANLGDRHPLDYGGYFVYVDETRVYEPEAEWLVPDDEDHGATIFRILLERMRVVDGYLVPYEYRRDWPHPLERYDAWFHGNLREIASSFGVSPEDLEAEFTSADPLIRADAYRALIEHYGAEEFDSDALSLGRESLENRYPEFA